MCVVEDGWAKRSLQATHHVGMQLCYGTRCCVHCGAGYCLRYGAMACTVACAMACAFACAVARAVAGAIACAKACAMAELLPLVRWARDILNPGLLLWRYG